MSPLRRKLAKRLKAIEGDGALDSVGWLAEWSADLVKRNVSGRNLASEYGRV